MGGVSAHLSVVSAHLNVISDHSQGVYDHLQALSAHPGTLYDHSPGDGQFILSRNTIPTEKPDIRSRSQVFLLLWRTLMGKKGRRHRKL